MQTNYIRLLILESLKNDEKMLAKALDIMEIYQLSFWDSNIVAAANIAGVKELWTEDLTEGQIYDQVKVMNPLNNL